MLTVLLGGIGVTLAVAGAWSHFEQWLSLLGVVVPPIGIVIVLDQLVFARDSRPPGVRWEAFAAWGAGALAALVVHRFAPQLSDALIGMLVAAATFTMVVLPGHRRAERVGG